MNKLRVEIHLEGGLVSKVIANCDIEYNVIDHDDDSLDTVKESGYLDVDEVRGL